MPRVEKSKAIQPLKTEGAKRIQIELEDEPKKAAEYAEKYNELIRSIVSIIKDEAKGKPIDEEGFFCMIWKIMAETLKITYGANKFGFLHESLDPNAFDCDTSAFLVYDVAKALNISANIVDLPPQPLADKYMSNGHALIKTTNFYFETTNGQYFPVGKLLSQYPIHQILKENEIQSVTYVTRGGAYSDKCNYDKAISDYGEAIRLNPKHTKVYYDRGIAYFQKGDYDKALSDFTTAICLNPKDANAFNNRGGIHILKGDYDKALSDCTEALRLTPNDADVYYNLGLAYKKKGDYDQAIVNFTEALRFNSKCTDAYYNRGKVYDNKGDYHKAISDYNQVLLINPRYENIFNNRGNTYFKKGDYDQAISDFSEALRFDSKDAETYCNRGNAYL
ncbi:MAG: tetratricopeptide repeat protein, partial [Candidatus Micrarchaeota archaeon]